LKDWRPIKEQIMPTFAFRRAIRSATLSVAALALLSTVLSGQEISKIEGLIKTRDGEMMTVKTSDSREITVKLTDSTNVGQVQGPLKARKKNMSMAALIPGLAVKVEGAYESPSLLIAKPVSFKGNDLEQAQAIQAGLHETQAQGEQNKAELEKQNAALQQHEQQLAANKAAIDAAVARFGQLDDYYILDEVTVYFGNGKTKVDPQYASQLVALADKAKHVNGYLVEVKGYASSTGSASLNQKLSEDRANAVTNILIQKGQVPLTRMLAPGAMGESNPASTDKTVEGQAENRRVVVRVLQNKAVAGV
jgi:outer membrane protein OmpA-like peptidoglycan-associated protein